MPSVVQTQTVSSVSYMLKDKSGEPIVSAFTAVNGRASPPSPRKLNGANGMTADTIHVRPHPQSHPEQLQDQKLPLSARDDWASGRRPSENGVQNTHYSVSPSLDERSPHSPTKRKRSSSVEDDQSYHSPDSVPAQARRRLDSYASGTRDSSPNTAPQVHPMAMEHSQQRTLPPMDRAEHDRNWPPRDSQDPNNAHYPNSRVVEMPQDGMHPQSVPGSQANGSMDSQHSLERSSTTEITRAGVQVDPKKRKRQFANRTKTGCGTCRRRKKKCDEAKPECNNCQRGGFICEGYANKVPWPKSGITKPHPPLQAKDRYPMEPAQLYHSHGAPREGYQEPGPSDGARARPIVVEEHDRQPPRNGWGHWSEPPRASHPPEHSQPPEYAHPPPTAPHTRPPPNEQYPQHPVQAPPPARQPTRIYHHTPQTMSQVVNTSPGVTAEAPLQHHHHSQPPMHQAQAPPLAHSGGPPAPPPAHYAPAPPPRQKSERDKMLSGEPFMPYHQHLTWEREECRKAVYRLNYTANEKVQITADERFRHFQALAAARWIPPSRGPEPQLAGHIGQEVFLDTPFHCDYGYNLVIHDLVTIGPGCKFLDSGKVTIGRNTHVGANVTIDTQKVPTDSKSVKGSRGLTVAAEVHIGENVYIGANATILAGVKIGTGAIIYPGSVVLKDVPRDCVARGNPANVQSVNWED